ncbi:MAG: MBL fold metallo-hydrolase [archaeon]|nr:MBL fold metallo-hydrolase [archaeon]
MSVEVHVLASGSDGNCAIVRCEDSAIMIDSGLSFKATRSLMAVNGIDGNELKGILVTHEHIDHIRSVQIVSKKLNLPIICNQNTFDASHFSDNAYRRIFMMNPFDIVGMKVIALPTSHDAVEPCAYFMDTGKEKILIATDMGFVTDQVEHALLEADIALIESNYDREMLETGPYPYTLKRRIDSDVGHLCNTMSGEVIKRTITNRQRKIFLAHLSKKNNTPDIARETVSRISGIKRMNLDCLEFKGDTRIIKG